MPVSASLISPELYFPLKFIALFADNIFINGQGMVENGLLYRWYDAIVIGCYDVVFCKAMWPNF